VDASRLAAFPVVADLPEAELRELASAMREVEIEAGVAVTSVDDYGTAIYFVEQGRPMSGQTAARRPLVPAAHSARSDSS
jgi:hypothetical protein